MIEIGAFKGIGTAEIGSFRNIADPVEMGLCCCSDKTFKSGYFEAQHDISQGGSNTIDFGKVYLFKQGKNGGSSGIYDVILTADVTPIKGVECSTAFYQTFTLNLLDGDEIVGSVTYEYVSGTPFSGTANLTIVYECHTYQIENVAAEGAFIQGLHTAREDWTKIDGVQQ